MAYDFRKDFPLLQQNKIAYLDNAATAQRPQCVIDAESSFYRNSNANPLRGLYSLSVEATEIYENARESVRDFLNASSTEEIIFTRGTTEGLNLVAYSYGLHRVKAGRRGAGVHYGAPQQPAALADGVPPDRREAPLYRVRT